MRWAHSTTHGEADERVPWATVAAAIASFADTLHDDFDVQAFDLIEVCRDITEGVVHPKALIELARARQA